MGDTGGAGSGPGGGSGTGPGRDMALIGAALTRFATALRPTSGPKHTAPAGYTSRPFSATGGTYGYDRDPA